jgi:hypothetical protein
VLPKIKDADIVQAQDVVRMFVGEDDSVQPSDSGAQSLLPKVGRGIDHYHPPVVL